MICPSAHGSHEAWQAGVVDASDVDADLLEVLLSEQQIRERAAQLAAEIERVDVFQHATGQVQAGGAAGWATNG